MTCPSSATGAFPNGSTTYSYDADGNLSIKTAPQPNAQSGTATVSTNYTYDALNRTLQKGYVGLTTPAALYGYDGVTLTGCNIALPSITSPTNLLGARSAMCSNLSSSQFSYDKMGRLINDVRNNKGSGANPTTFQATYTYWKDGSLNTLKYPSGDVLTYTVKGAGRVTQVTDSTNNFVVGATYAPHGALTGMTSGTNIVTANIYNNRLQPVFLSAGASGNSFFSLCYDFHLRQAINTSSCQFNGSLTGNNGNVFQIVNNAETDARHQVQYQYDPLNRISQASTATTATNCWGEIYTIDAWGNLTNRTGPAGMGGCLTEPMNYSASAQNRLNGLNYDVAGNVLNDSIGNAVTYDAENRIATDAGYTYSYDADGVRTEKAAGSGTMYWPGVGGVLTETDLTGAINGEYVFFNGARIARLDRPSGTPHYYFSDHLGSASVITDGSGGSPTKYYYYPYGGLITSSGSDPNRYKFTGKERDGESGLDNFGARYNVSNIGRFMTPDALNTLDLSHPQKLNRYAYANNNPLASKDVGGRCTAPAVSKGQVGICVESYIRTLFLPGVKGKFALGDHRGKDPHGGTFRTQTLLRVDLSTHEVSKAGEPVAGQSCAILGCAPGVNHSDLSKISHDEKGNTYFTLTVYGENGYEAQGKIEAPGGWIEMQFSFKVNSKGQVTVLSAETKGYPSASVYSYDPEGDATDVWEQTESGNIKDLFGPRKRAESELQGSNPTNEELQRQCALGNAAACN